MDQRIVVWSWILDPPHSPIKFCYSFRFLKNKLKDKRLLNTLREESRENEPTNQPKKKGMTPFKSDIVKFF